MQDNKNSNLSTLSNLSNFPKSNKMDDFSNFKNLLSLNESLLEATKSAIKSKNNELVLKMMDNLGERPELWYEYLSVRNKL